MIGEDWRWFADDRLDVDRYEASDTVPAMWQSGDTGEPGARVLLDVTSSDVVAALIRSV